MEDPWADGVDDEETRWIRNQRREMQDEDFTFCDSAREADAEITANILREVSSLCTDAALLLLLGTLSACSLLRKPEAHLFSADACGRLNPCRRQCLIN